ncbi:hypothetical protein Glove_43g86 [Diversispora epigaea]|uniref:Uncharacterized protein n=1 Tax=Diversispora epigaea TaxID=1348612 RepID=A0A397JPR2_9GLOM|nr:hypothetical protein Glove_43g86 [Diversispora epigaea]
MGKHLINCYLKERRKRNQIMKFKMIDNTEINDVKKSLIPGNKLRLKAVHHYLKKTVTRWLKNGFCIYSKYAKGMYTDGHLLIEKYSLKLWPGWQLKNEQPLRKKEQRRTIHISNF